MSDYARLGVTGNPFEPSATGLPIKGAFALQPELEELATKLLDTHLAGQGPKAIVVVGEYGSGKTCLLQWLHDTFFPTRNVASYYFGNPGVHFYDLANKLLRTIGRKDFAKFIWELAGSYVDVPVQADMFREGFEVYLTGVHRRKTAPEQVIGPLQSAIMKADVTEDEEIAHCLARIVTGIVKKPYFSYRDFVPKGSGNVVAEGEEAPYLSAVLKTIMRGTGTEAMAFLVDEFEEIGLQKRLTKRAAHDYLSTMKRLINLTMSDDLDFWLILSMTPDAFKTTVELQPSLVDRFSDRKVEVPPLGREDALAVVRGRIHGVRPSESGEAVDDLYPFSEEAFFRPYTYSNPRRLVKSCFRAIANARESTLVPFDREYLWGVEDELYGDAAGEDVSDR